MICTSTTSCVRNPYQCYKSRQISTLCDFRAGCQTSQSNTTVEFKN